MIELRLKNDFMDYQENKQSFPANTNLHTKNRPPKLAAVIVFDS